MKAISRLVFQNLRAQEAAQAEAEDREDLEIAAEAAGSELHQSSRAAHQCTQMSLKGISHLVFKF